MKTKLTHFGNPGDGVHALSIGIAGRSPAKLTNEERDFPGSDTAVTALIRSRLPADIRDEFHSHKNRDNSFTYAMGLEPEVWPEDAV